MGKPLKYWNGSAWIHVGAENLSELTADATHRLVTDTEKSTWNAKISASGVTYENLNTNGDVGTGSTQVAKGDHTHSADGDKADKLMTINEKTANYSLVAGDVAECIKFNSASDLTLTIPKNTTTALSVGFQCVITGIGSGSVTIDPATDVTLNGGTDSLEISAQYKAVSLLKIATDTWLAWGAI